VTVFSRLAGLFHLDNFIVTWQLQFHRPKPKLLHLNLFVQQKYWFCHRCL